MKENIYIYLNAFVFTWKILHLNKCCKSFAFFRANSKLLF